MGITGYDGLERTHLGRLVYKLGAKFSEKFTKKHTHLICNPLVNNSSAPKFKKAVEWRVPCVDGAWLLNCAKDVREMVVPLLSAKKIYTHFRRHSLACRGFSFLTVKKSL